jgi:putative transposase
MQNGYRMANRFITEDILDAYYFNDNYQLQKISNKWREDYNFNHLHNS